MALALACPHCHTNRVETVRKAWYIQGFLLFARYGSKPYIGCASCTRSKVLQRMAVTTFFGWWCFPWGLGTPLALVQNLASVAGGPDEAGLRRLLTQQGVDVDDLEIDEHGRARGDTRLVKGVLSTLHQMIWADGEADHREVATATHVAEGLLGDLAGPDEIATTLTSPESPGSIAPRDVTPDLELILLRAACAVAEADGVVDASEIEAIYALGNRLGVAPDLVRSFVDRLNSTPAEDPEEQRLRAMAAEILAIDPDASPAAVRDAWQHLSVEASALPEDEAANRREQLDFAYQTLLGAAAA